MHQLAVVGGGRNANGMPGVFGPADGRGQSCLLSACAIVHACAYSSDGPKSIFKTKQISPLDAYPAANGPRESNSSGFNLAKSVSQYKHEPTSSYQGQLVQQPIFLSPNPSPLSIRFKEALQLCLCINLTTLVVEWNKAKAPSCLIELYCMGLSCPTHYVVRKRPRLCK